MAVPKRKTSKCRRNNRNANKGIEAGSFTHCSNTGFPVAPHTVCLESGYYNGKKVLPTKFERAMKRNKDRKDRMQRMQARQQAMQEQVKAAQDQQQAAQEKKAAKAEPKAKAETTKK